MAAIPSTEVVYFFFEETASEFEFFDKLHTSRVARVCKVGRLGGRRSRLREAGPAAGGGACCGRRGRPWERGPAGLEAEPYVEKPMGRW